MKIYSLKTIKEKQTSEIKIFMSKNHGTLIKERKMDIHCESLSIGKPYSTFHMPYHSFTIRCGTYHSYT